MLKAYVSVMNAKAAIARKLRDEQGATAIEYGLIAAGISIAIITVVFAMGSQLETMFTNLNDKLATAPTGN